jgi:hypothetical protein
VLFHALPQAFVTDLGRKGQGDGHGLSGIGLFLLVLALARAWAAVQRSKHSRPRAKQAVASQTVRVLEGTPDEDAGRGNRSRDPEKNGTLGA